MNVGSTKRIIAATLPALALAATPALAATGISPIDRVLELIGSLFNITVLHNAATAAGVAKFGWFLIIFTLLNWSGRRFAFRGDDAISKRTSNVVAAILGIMSVVFMPNDFILSTTSGYMAIIWSLLIMAPAIGVLVFSYLRVEGGRTNSRRLIELMLLILVFVWTTFLGANLDAWIGSVYPDAVGITGGVVSWAIVILLFTIIGKLLAMTPGAAGEGKGGWDRMKDLFGSNEPKVPKPPSAQAPSKPTGVEGRLMPEYIPRGPLVLTDTAEIWWDPNPEEERVSHYEVMVKGAKGGKKSLNDLRHIPTKENPYRVSLKDVFGDKWDGEPSLNVYVRAVSRGGKSKWVVQTINQENKASHKIDFKEIEEKLAALGAARDGLDHVVARMRELHNARRPASPALIAHIINLLHESKEEAARIAQLLERLMHTDSRFGETTSDTNKFTSLLNSFQIIMRDIAFNERILHELIP